MFFLRTKRIHGYPLDTHADPVALAQIEIYSRHLRENLFPQLGVFSTFDIHLVAYGSLGDDLLGRYLTGSWERPVMFLDLQTCRDVARQRRFTRTYVIYSTVLHELGHAMQEAHGRPFVEDEAEEFAMQFYRSGTVLEFWRQVRH